MPTKNGQIRAVEPAEVFDFFSSEATDTFYLTPDQRLWVRIKRELDFGEQNELDNASLVGYSVEQIRAMGTNERTVIHTDLGKQRLLRMALYIEDWNLTDREGKTIRWPRKVDERQALLKRMNPKWAAMIDGEILRLITTANATAEAEGYPAVKAGDEDGEAEPNPTGLAVTGEVVP